jgi:uroporphyrinogen decarboxylase
LTRSTIRQNGFNAELHFRSIYKLADRIAPDAIFHMMDLSLEAGAIGLQVRYPLEESATVEIHPVRSVSDLDQYKVLDPLFDARLRSYIDTTRLMAERISGPLIGAYVIGPFTLSGLLIGATEVAVATIEDPDLVLATLNFAEDVITRYARELVRAGADMVAILEPTATFLSPTAFTMYCGNYISRLVRRLDTMTVLHICGNTTGIIPAMAATGVQGLSLDGMVDLAAAAQRIPDDVVLIGNIDPVRVMLRGTEDEVRAEVRSLLDAMAPFPNFVISTGCDLPQETPIANILALVDETRRWRANATVA